MSGDDREEAGPGESELGAEGPHRANLSPPHDQPALKEPFDPEPGRERLRGWIAAALTGLFIVVILLAFLLFILNARPISALKDFLILVIPPVASLVSAVCGFYYGSTRGRD